MRYHDISKVAGIKFSDLFFLPSGVHNCADTQTSAGTQDSVPVIKISMVLLK